MQLNSRIVACLFLLAACSVHDQNLIPDINTSQLGKNLTEQLTPVLETLKDSPGNAETAGQAGNILQAYEQHGLAAKLYEHALAISPNKFAWEYNLGVAYASLGRYADSQTSFEQYIQHDATYAPAFLRLARSLSEQGHYSESISNYHAFLKKRPGNSQALFGLGRVQVAMGNLAEAKDYLLGAVEATPGFGEAHYALAMLYRDQGMLSESQQHLEKYEQNKQGAPANDDPQMQAVLRLRISAAEYLKLGVEAKQAGRIKESIKLHLSALEENPALLQAHINLLILYGARGQTEAASRQYREGLAISSDSAELHYNYGVVCYQAGNAQEAKQAFQAALAVNPEHALANHNMGQVLEEEQRLDEAITHYNRALANRPDHGLSHYKLGVLWMQKRRPRDAVRHLNEAVKENSDRTPSYLYALAAALVASGHRAQAIATFQTARQQAEHYGQADLVQQVDIALRQLN